MPTIIFQPSSDSFLSSDHRWMPTLRNMIMGLGTEIMDEMHFMEQFFIKLQNMYAFVCQICFFIVCDSVIENEDLSGSKGDKSVITALTTTLFYSVFAYFATRLRDIWRRNSSRASQTTPSIRSYFKWLCKIALEWAKAIIVVLCLREQGIHYEPKLAYSVVTFTYYLCTEKIFLEIFPALVELFNLEKLENLEHLYVPLCLNMYAIIAGITVAMYTIFVKYSHFVLLTIYFLVYLRIKDAYYNYWELIVAERETYSSFRTATQKEIQDWADICAVCLNNMSRARITPCNHLFHPYCLKQCLKTSFNCPLCKRHFIEQGES